ncbi:hypothetical protein AG1IA_00132 [Rhizoctonia solani AG-1 IA]|uniref:Uncharacterized protein n=1 Tax=Thanatephorus cucumeris (strain AG1-IA) TaxID=983506 RepID=L8X6N0_THACA|nr:hypothetical protein AG1IA_00132 [Rhizoctonia solani AG-1 IA]
MRSEELVRWTTMGISCAIGVQLLLFVLPSLRPYGTIIQVLLALGACGALAYVAVTDRRQNGNLTTDGHNRNELKMIGMFFILCVRNHVPNDRCRGRSFECRCTCSCRAKVGYWP